MPVQIDTAEQVIEWLKENPGPYIVGLFTNEAGKNSRSAFDYTAGYVCFQADRWEDAGDCLVFGREDGLALAAFVKAAFGEVAEEGGTLVIFYNNLEVRAPGFLPVVLIAITKI